MTRIRDTNTVVCDGCGVEITWAPVVLKKRMYCCKDCAAGLPCQCDYPPEEVRVRPTQPPVEMVCQP